MIDEEAAYFGRQVILPDFGWNAQNNLKLATVIVVGAGGLGSSCLQYLAGVGVGNILIVDFDKVDASNLHRQTIHGVSQLDRGKVASAISRCKDINPHVRLQGFTQPLDMALADKLFPVCDLILDCTDNLPVRLCISDGAMHHRKPVVSGAALQYSGQMLVYGLDENHSYRSLLGEEAPGAQPAATYETDMLEGEALRRLLVPFSGFAQSCGDSGVLGPVPGLIGNLMALTAVKLLTNPMVFKECSGTNFTTYDYNNTDKPFATYRLIPKCPDTRENGDISAYWRPDDYVHRCPKDVAPRLQKELQVEWETLIARGDLSEFQSTHPVRQTEDKASRQLFLDVRPTTQAKIVTLTGVVNNICCPLNLFLTYIQECVQCLHKQDDIDPRLQASNLGQLIKDKTQLYVYCRMGNASRVAVTHFKLLQRAIADLKNSRFLQGVEAVSILGGLSELRASSPEWGQKLRLLP